MRRRQPHSSRHRDAGSAGDWVTLRFAPLSGGFFLSSRYDGAARQIQYSTVLYVPYGGWEPSRLGVLQDVLGSLATHQRAKSARPHRLRGSAEPRRRPTRSLRDIDRYAPVTSICVFFRCFTCTRTSAEYRGSLASSVATGRGNVSSSSGRAMQPATMLFLYVYQ